ncbi:8-oxo-dGTP diphosphatase [Microdochium nivale]|nr:8-oxo-dGTP diphosphatase [Microdochium nivale]
MAVTEIPSPVSNGRPLYPRAENKQKRLVVQKAEQATPLITMRTSASDLMLLRGPPGLTPSAHLDKYMISPTEFIRQSQGRVQQLVAAVVVMHMAGAAPASTARTLLIQRSRHDWMGLRWEIAGGSCEDGDHSILLAAARELGEEAGLCVSRMLDVVEDDHQWLDSGKVWRKMTFLAEAVATEKEVAAAATAIPGHVVLEPSNPAMDAPNKTSGSTDTNITGSRALDSAARPEDGVGAPSSQELLKHNRSVSQNLPLVTLDPNEHEDFVWATEADVRAGSCQGRTLAWTTKHQQRTILRAFEMMKARERL